MKKILLSLVAAACATVSFAQTSLLATLSHEGSISTYYGINALKSAMDEAVDGDAITLSAGQFNAVNITKSVTLRGAGMSVNSEEGVSHESTIIQGAFDMDLSEDETNRVAFEGLYFTGKMTCKGTVRNPLMMKTRFNSIEVGTGGKLVNATFLHCRVADGVKLISGSNANFINSVVWNPNNSSTSDSNFEFNNCVVRIYQGNEIINSNFRNSSVWVYTNSYYLPYSNVAYNCIGHLGSSGDPFSYIASKNQTNEFVTYSVYKNNTFSEETYTDYLTFELTDEAKAKYLGTDGTEVGLYGGSIPYEEDPTTPQITKCNVAAKSTADGKLSVDIEVKAAEY